MIKAVLLLGPNYVIAVCQDEEPGYWLERYDKPPTPIQRPLDRNALGQPTHVSGRMTGNQARPWVMDTFLPGYKGLLDDHNEQVIAEMLEDIDRAVRSLSSVQMANT